MEPRRGALCASFKAAKLRVKKASKGNRFGTRETNEFSFWKFWQGVGGPMERQQREQSPITTVPNKKLGHEGSDDKAGEQVRSPRG